MPASASKAAVNMFTESLAKELQPFSIRAHLVIPGLSQATRFNYKASERAPEPFPPDYADMAAQVQANMAARPQDTQPVDVAKAIWQVATNPDSERRIAVGLADAAKPKP